MKVKFYLKASGRSPVEEFLANCSQELRADFYDAIYLVHAFKKKTQELPKQEIEVTLKRLREV